MRHTYKVHLRSGTIIKFKADDFTFEYANDGKMLSWKAPNASRWISFLPADLVGVERVRWFR